MDMFTPRRGIIRIVLTALAVLTLTLTAMPAGASPARTQPNDTGKVFLDYYEGHHATTATKTLNKALRHLTDPLRAPVRPATVKKVSAVGYASFGFDCGVLITHTKGDGKRYGVAIWTWGLLDTPARNALDYPVSAKDDPRHVDVRASHRTAAAIDVLLKTSLKGCS